MPDYNCPCCRKSVGENHFACTLASTAGSATGASKKRGDADYYRRIQAKSARARKRNRRLREQQK